MGAVKGVLKEEYRRLESLEKRYLREIAKLQLQKGSLQEKVIKGVRYPYWVSSRKSKVRYRYLGNLQENKLKQLKEKLVLRKKYQALLKEVQKNKKQIFKIVHGK